MNKSAWISTFALISASAFYFLWILVIQSPGFSQLESLCPVPYFPVDENSRASTSHRAYTGLSAIDWNLCVVTSVFIESMRPEVFDTTFSLVYGLPPIAAFPLIEYMRGKAPDTVMPAIIPMLIGVLFQRIGAGLVLPLYYIYLISSDRAHAKSQEQIASRPAAAIFFALIFVYYIPSHLMLSTADPTWTAAWQPFPLYIGLWQLLMHLLLPVFSRPSGATIVRGIYTMCFLISAFTHLYRLYQIRKNIIGGLTDLFLPSATAIQSTYPPLVAKNFFQWDNIFICGSAAVFTFRYATTGKQRLGLLLTYFVGSFLFGPGASVALVLYWREMKLAHARNGLASKRK